MSLGSPPFSWICSHRQIWDSSFAKCAQFFSLPVDLFCFLEERQMTEQRDSWPSQSWSCCSTCFPKQAYSGARTERKGLLAGSHPFPCPWPSRCFSVGRATWLPEAQWTEAALGQGDDGAAAPPCCPAWEEECRARQVSLCVLWGGRSRYRQGRGGQGLLLLWHRW